MSTLRKEFNNLVEVMQKYDLYQIDDEVGMCVQKLSDKIDETYNRIICVINTNDDSRGIISKYEDVLSFDDLEVLERSCKDIEIAMDLTDTEPIENDWYGLFAEPKENVSRETLEEPPTSLCKTPQTHEFVKDIIAKLKVIDVDGETMQYIIEQVGMNDQMLRQLIMSNPESDTIDLFNEKVKLSNESLVAMSSNK